MPAQNIDIVFLIDASESMLPCFNALRSHLENFLAPMQGGTGQTIRLGLLAHAAGYDQRGSSVYDHIFIGGRGLSMLKKLYTQKGCDEDFFTTNPEKFKIAVGKVECKGNEEMLVALDTALDFPFGQSMNTRRVVVMFSNEKLEDGIDKGKFNSRIPELIQKIHDRKITLFACLPDSEGACELAGADGSEIVDNEGGEHAWDKIDFGKLLAQMGKSISCSSLQAISEPSYRRGLFGQENWVAGGCIVTGE